MKNKVIYRHLKPNGEVFYIGIGSLKRAFSDKGRNKFWERTVSKYGYEIQILKSDLTWEEAAELEIDLISFYGRKDLGTGTLVNMTDGGEGRTNVVVSDETRNKLSEVHKGRKMSEEVKLKISKANKGHKCSDETKAKLSEAHTGKTMSEETRLKLSEARKGKPSPNKGKPHSEESKRKMSEALKGRVLGKTCLVLDTQTGVFYNSITEASFYYDINRNTLSSMLNGRRTNKTNLIKM